MKQYLIQHKYRIVKRTGLYKRYTTRQGKLNNMYSQFYSYSKFPLITIYFDSLKNQQQYQQPAWY